MDRTKLRQWLGRRPRTAAAGSERRLPLFMYVRSLKEARGWWPHIAIIAASGLAGIPLGLLAPLPFKIVLDHVLGAVPLPRWAHHWLPEGLLSPSALLFVAIGLGLLLAVAALAHNTGDWLLREWVAERMVRRFRGKMFLHALSMSPIDSQRQGSLDQSFRINQDANALQWTAIYGLIPVINALAALLGTLAVTWSMSPRLAAVALLTSIPLLVLIQVNQRGMCDRWHKVRDLDSAAAAVVNEALSAHRVVATCGQERREAGRLLDKAGLAFTARLRVMVAQGAFGLGLALSTALGTAAILYLGVQDVFAGALTAGELTMVMAYVAQLYAPLQAIGSHMASQQQAISSAERAFDLLDARPSVADRLDARPLARAAGHVEFRDVGFSYADGTRVLVGVSFVAEPGTCVGVVGRSGSGKTTLLNLLSRLVDPAEGRILLDGADLRDLRLGDLRRQFAIVSQEPVLFSCSIAENIAYARPDARDADIAAAARAAKAHDFIANLPDGYATMVGERGARLSGGERQRIALARAFLSEAPILILDEPTSALDAATEAGIVDAVEALMIGRTTFIVSHRLSALRSARMVLRIEDGRVYEEFAAPQLVA